MYPAAYDSVISVGSVDPDLQVSSFSSGGTNVDLLAPGRDLLSLKPDGSYAMMSGTTFAALPAATAAMPPTEVPTTVVAPTDTPMAVIPPTDAPTASEPLPQNTAEAGA